MTNKPPSLLARRVRHLIPSKFVSMSLLLGLITLLILFWPVAFSKEPAIRWWGMALQFVGIYSVVRELRARGQDVGAPGLLEVIRSWCSRWPSRDVTVGLTGVSATTNAGDILSARGRVGNLPGASLEDRIMALEKQINVFDEGLDQVRNGLAAERRERELGLLTNKTEHAAALQTLRENLDAASARTLPLSRFGVVWLAVGVGFSSTSVELAKCLLF